MSSKPTPNLKQNTVLAFDDGLLTIKQSGHGDANGWGELAFHERQVEIDPDGFHKVEIPPSELRELRDFLNRTLPAAETGLTRQQLREQRDRFLTILKTVHEQFECPARNTNRGRAYREGVTISNDLREEVRAAIASVEAAS